MVPNGLMKAWRRFADILTTGLNNFNKSPETVVTFPMQWFGNALLHLKNIINVVLVRLKWQAGRKRSKKIYIICSSNIFLNPMASEP